MIRIAAPALALLAACPGRPPLPSPPRSLPSVPLSAGAGHVCSVRAGTVRCIGDNRHGQLGDGTREDRHRAVTVPGLAKVVAVAAGALHTCALLADGAARCWGLNEQAQLGDGTTEARASPAPVRGLAPAVALAAGGVHTCALGRGGTVHCWGNNHVGQLGDGTRKMSAVPVAVRGLSGARAIAAGQAHACAVVADGAVRCWGWNKAGQVGDGTTVDRPEPALVLGLRGAVAVSAGPLGSHTCALLEDGTARCWGWNRQGQIGDGTTEPRATPVPVKALAGARAISAGAEHTCALLEGGGVRCWGANDRAQVGAGSAAVEPGPIAVPDVAGVAAIAAGPLGGTTAILARGRGRGWGAWWMRAQGAFPAVRADLFEFRPPPGYQVRPEAGGALTFRDPAAPRLLELWTLRARPPREPTGAVDLRSAVPTIGKITATTPAGEEKREGRTLLWFRQRSSVSHTPMVGVGFLAPKGDAYVVVRFVGREEAMGNARPLLESWLREGTLRLR